LRRYRLDFAKLCRSNQEKRKDWQAHGNLPERIAWPNPTLTLSNCATKVLRRANPSIAFGAELPFGAARQKHSSPRLVHDRSRFADMGGEVFADSPAEFGKLVADVPHSAALHAGYDPSIRCITRSVG
jgi:hypothetical protein